jgi:hypothetical protein
MEQLLQRGGEGVGGGEVDGRPLEVVKGGELVPGEGAEGAGQGEEQVQAGQAILRGEVQRALGTQSSTAVLWAFELDLKIEAKLF